LAIKSSSLAKAKSRLRVAEKSLREIGESKTYEEFVDSWFTYLMAVKNIYTVLEQGAKSTPQDRQWFGAIKAKRKNDELLQYLFQARNDDGHGVNLVTDYVKEEVVLRGVTSVIVGKGKIAGFSESGKPVPAEHTLPHVRLATVNGRANERYSPPTEHLGNPIGDPTAIGFPNTVATLGLEYFTQLVSDAESRA